MLYSLYQSRIAGANSFRNSSFLYLQPCVKCKSQVVEELIVSVSALNILSNKSDNSDSEGQIEITLRFSVNKESL